MCDKSVSPKKCELCNKMTDKLYKVYFADDADIDEDGIVHVERVPYLVCSGCVPEEQVDIIDE
jgi:hypothetical protein